MQPQNSLSTFLHTVGHAAFFAFAFITMSALLVPVFYPSRVLQAAGGVTLNSADKSSNITLSSGNLAAGVLAQTPQHHAVRATNGMSTGKWYWEVFASIGPANTGNIVTVGLMSADALLYYPGGYVGGSDHGFGWGYATDGGTYYSAGFSAWGSAPPLTNGWKRFAYDADTGKLWIGDASGWQGGGDPASGSNPTAVYPSRAKPMYPAASFYYAGPNVGFGFNFGSSAFQYALPSSFKQLNDINIVVTVPSCSLSANPTTIQSGSTTTLSWNSQNASSGSIDNGIGSVALSGSIVVSPTATTTYTATFTGSPGATVTCSAVVAVIVPPSPPPPAPTCTMSASPSSIQQGGSATVTWSSTNASSSSFTGGITSTAANGSVTVSPSATTTYIGTFTSPTGSVSCQTTVAVTPLPPQPTSSYITVTDAAYGAKGDCSTDDTVAFQKAIDDAVGPNGKGKIIIPATNSCYLVGKLNGTNRSNVIIQGAGDQSLIKVNGKDSQDNWWDLSGSSDVVFRDLKVTTGNVVPKTLFLWAWNGATLNKNLLFDHVNIDAKSSAAHLYAWGYNNGLTLRDGTWYQRHNGVGQTNPSLRTSVVRFDNINSFPQPASSAYIAVGQPGSGVSWGTSLYAMSLIDAPAGYGGGNRGNNAALVCVQCGAALLMQGGQLLGVGEAIFVGWNFVEGITLDSITVGPHDHSTNTVAFPIRLGGAPNNNTAGNVTLRDIFFIGAPVAGGAYIGIENPGPNGMTALGQFKLLSPDIGGNGNNAHLMAPTGLGCTAPVAAGWIINNSEIDAVGESLVFCGNVDLSNVIRDAGPIITPPGVTQTGCKFTAANGYNCAL